MDSNLILSSLPEAERSRLFLKLAPVEFPLRFMFAEIGRPIEWVYFVSAGLGSVVTELASGAAVETVMTGREGCTGFPLVLGLDRSPARIFQQIAGAGLRISTRDFLDALRESPSLRSMMALYAGFLLTQSMQNTACNRAHDATARCARWLLLSSDRSGQLDLSLTHDFLAQMLGATRPVVTTTLHKLEASGAIEPARGSIRITDAGKLKSFACECYFAIAAACERYETAIRAAGNGG